MCLLLVRLGANTSAKLSLPAQPTDPTTFLYNKWDLNGKTIEELATLAAKPQLIALIDEYKDPVGRLENVHCRCGSRYPGNSAMPVVLISIHRISSIR